MRKPVLVFSLLLFSGAAFAQPGPVAPSINSLDLGPKPVCLDSSYSITSKAAAIIASCTKILADPKTRREERYFAFGRRATARMSRRDFEAAIADFSEASRIFPDEVQIYEKRAGAYLSIGKIDLARKDIDTALRLNPNDPTILNGSCWIYGAQFKIEAALRDCNKSLAIRPGDTQTLDSRAFAYYRAGKNDLALKEYNAILTRAPKSAASLYVRGILKRKMGDLAGGNKDMHAAAALEPDIVDYFSHFGLTRGN